MLLPADRHPEADARRISQRPQHCDLVVAHENRGVATVARVSERADTEHPVVDEVADENGVPLISWIRPQRLEEALEIAVDVTDDQDRQIFRSHSSPRPSTHRTMLTLPSADRGVAQLGQSIGLQNRGSEVRILTPLPFPNTKSRDGQR